jgi:O-methyltransferase involved in polyketide biosynthesis
MPEKILQTLQGVSETLLIPLYIRARESQRPDGLISDEQAVRMVSQIEYDFSHLKLQRHDEIALIVRTNKFDSHVRDFLKRNPESVVVHIGCGLDTRFERVDNGQVEWFDLDLPEVMRLRQKLIHSECSHYHALAASVLEDSWLDEVSRFKPRPFMFMAEGVLPYFEEAQVKSLFLKLGEHFPGCELVCEAHTPFGNWANNLHLAYVKSPARMHWSLKGGKEVENWGGPSISLRTSPSISLRTNPATALRTDSLASPREGSIRLLDEWYYYDDEDSPLKAYRWMRLIQPIAKSSGIFHYHLGV